MIERDGVRLAWRDFGGTGPPALLLHGLAGHAGEWSDTAAWLSGRCRVLALDQRGHGRSERVPDDVSRAACVADTLAVIETLSLGPVLLIGQSLGGHLALLVAAARPDLARALVIAEASPAGGDREAVEESVRRIGRWLRNWPVPFASRDAAIAYFGGPTLRAQAWAAGLERRDGGLWAAFDVGVMERTLREAMSAAYWQQWDEIRCPTLIVRAGNGTLDADTVEQMLRRQPHAELVEIADAGHDVHLERPGEWRTAVMGFQDSLAVRWGAS